LKRSSREAASIALAGNTRPTIDERQLDMLGLKILGAAGVLLATALVGGTLIGSAFASGDDPATTDGGALAGPAAGEYCDVFLDTFAAELGVERSALGPAARTAATAAIDAAVAGGELDAERAERIKERIANADGDVCALAGRAGGFWRHGGGPVGAFLHGLADSAAATLGLEASDLVAQLRDGATLQEIAAAQGVPYEDVTAAVVADAQARLNEAVASGRITQERADSILERLNEALAEGRFGNRP